MPLPVYQSYKVMELMYSPSGSDLSRLPCWSPECHSRYAQQGLLSGLLTGIGLSNPSWEIPKVGNSRGGPYSPHSATRSVPYSAQEEA